MSSLDNAGKLTPERVAEFKAVMHDGRSLVELHKDFPECSVSTLSDIRKSKTWRNIKPKGLV